MILVNLKRIRRKNQMTVARLRWLMEHVEINKEIDKFAKRLAIELNKETSPKN